MAGNAYVLCVHKIVSWKGPHGARDGGSPIGSPMERRRSGEGSEDAERSAALGAALRPVGARRSGRAADALGGGVAELSVRSERDSFLEYH